MTTAITTQSKPQSQSLAISKPILPTTSEVEAMWKMAQFAAKTNLVSSSRAEDAFFIIVYGQELGIAPMSALQSIYVVKGKPTCSGQLMLALIRRSGLSKRIEIKMTDGGNACEVEMERIDGDKYIEKFTMDDAADAGLVGKDNWKKHPQQMLKWRAVSNAARTAFPDVILGLYTSEEINPEVSVDENGRVLDRNQIVNGTPPQESQNGAGREEREHAGAEEETPPKAKPKAKRAKIISVGGGKDPGEDDESDDEEKAWHESKRNIGLLTKKAVKDGLIEEGDGIEELENLVGKKASEFETGAEFFKEAKSVAEELDRELAAQTFDEDDRDEGEAEIPEEKWDEEKLAHLNRWIAQVFSNPLLVTKKINAKDLSLMSLPEAKISVLEKMEEVDGIKFDRIRKQGKGKLGYLKLFHSDNGEGIETVRVYSRQKLAEMVGENTELGKAVKDLKDNDDEIHLGDMEVRYKANRTDTAFYLIGESINEPF